MYSWKSGCNRQTGCIWAKVVVICKVVVFGKSGCIRAKVVVVLQSGCIWTKVVVFGQKYLYSGKVVVFGQKCLLSGKNVLFGQSRYTRVKWFIRTKQDVFLQSGYIFAK